MFPYFHTAFGIKIEFQEKMPHFHRWSERSWNNMLADDKLDLECFGASSVQGA